MFWCSAGAHCEVVSSELVSDWSGSSRHVGEEMDVIKVSSPLPTGTVTFLLTDVEGSTAAWERATIVGRAGSWCAHCCAYG